MLQHSKFVNTKAYQKANPKKAGHQFPSFSRASMTTEKSRQYDSTLPPEKTRLNYELVPQSLPEPVKESLPQDAVEESFLSSYMNELESVQKTKPEELEPALKQPLPRHGSVNLEAMQKQEDIASQEEDWLAFFMGNASTKAEVHVLPDTTALLITADSESIVTAAPPQFEDLSIEPFSNVGLSESFFAETSPEAILKEESLSAKPEISWAEAAAEAAKEIAALKQCEEDELAAKCAQALAEVEKKAWSNMPSPPPPTPRRPESALVDPLLSPSPTPIPPAPHFAPATVASTVAPILPIEPVIEPIVEPSPAPVHVNPAPIIEEPAKEPEPAQVAPEKDSVPAPRPEAESDGASSLNDIFNEMISDDQIFKRSAT